VAGVFVGFVWIVTSGCFVPILFCCERLRERDQALHVRQPLTMKHRSSYQEQQHAAAREPAGQGIPAKTRL
jgi:hypothetical protein